MKRLDGMDSAIAGLRRWAREEEAKQMATDSEIKGRQEIFDDRMSAVEGRR